MTWDTFDERRIWVVETLRGGKYIPTIQFGHSREEARAQQKVRKGLYPNAKMRVRKYTPED